MRQTIVSLVDDLDGSDATETVTFGIDGQLYEIDLSASNADHLRSALDDWVAKARRSGDERRTLTRSTTVLPAVGESRNALIRAWAAEHGHHAPARGRIPQSVVQAYDAAQR
ncbi:Lsr2 family protein [Terrabacter aerolatus]|uniref:Lsr2 family protein n=1 Tax=Terrabacter aerolatus TaxID=422442 RepID=A0A512D0N4_9MICO|nr:Lsr2 family protein [Terrabacter aerolatus]GEO30026.1 Lsr2 family protein [Terrabacter aerolatus]